MAEKRPSLATRYLGLDLPSPIIAGSCGLTNSLENIVRCAEAGAGAVVLKSIFEEQITAEVADLVEKSQDSFLHPEAAEYVRAYGQADAVGKYLNLIREAKQAVSIPVIASVHCVSPGSWTDFSRQAEEAGADALELNVFIMPADVRRAGTQIEQIYFDIIREVTARSSIPVALKISTFFSGLAQTILKFSRSGIAGLVLFNHFHRPDFDIDALKIIPAPLFSTPDEIYLPLRWVALMSGEVECDLAASTGIHDGAGAIKQLLAGAAATQVATVLYRQGIDHIRVMNDEISAWMDQHGYTEIDAFRGKLSQERSEDPGAFERVQFMKMSVGVE
ncbi:MAG: dihydroorotate dehydrogenase-like protein [Candidatus Eisenbacteria sp.]|nr:dihydroorotate dehydrogenase-like protein [Candidatus Eisenbacteria bacterium]